MKKMLCVLAGIVSMCGLLSGCDYSTYDFCDTEYGYNQAVINFGDGCETINIKSWCDSEDGEQLTITATDGTVYLVSSYNCVLIKPVE